jgi:hypothetical protein
VGVRTDRAPLIKAWNNVLTSVLSQRGLAAATDGRLALSAAGDDLAAKSLGDKLAVHDIVRLHRSASARG